MGFRTEPCDPPDHMDIRLFSTGASISSPSIYNDLYSHDIQLVRTRLELTASVFPAVVTSCRMLCPDNISSVQTPRSHVPCMLSSNLHTVSQKRRTRIRTGIKPSPCSSVLIQKVTISGRMRNMVSFVATRTRLVVTLIREMPWLALTLLTSTFMLTTAPLRFPMEVDEKNANAVQNWKNH